jgi:peptidyl-prolyl cis-trans isomerase SurA
MTLQRGVVGGQAMVTPAETKAYQEAHSANVYQVGDILIPLSNEPSQHTLDQASKKAEEIKQALSQSKNFLDTANKYAPNNHTVLDWSPLTDLPDVFANTIQATRVNDAAGPVRAQNGLHVLYLLGKKKNTQALPEKQVEMMLYQEKAEKIISPWLKKLRDTSDIQIIGSV